MKPRLLAILLALAATALAEDWVKHYADRKAAFEAENKQLDAATKHVVLVGDSLTEGWTKPRIQRFLPDIADRVLNRGISADGVGLNDRGVLHRLEASFFDCKASHAFLLIGVNDIGKDGSGVERAAACLEKVVRAVKEKKGAPELFLITLAPAAKGYKAMNPAIEKYNVRVHEIAAATSTTLIDLHALVKDEKGALPEDQTPDGLHWKDGVYEKLGAEIEKAALRQPARKKR